MTLTLPPYRFALSLQGDVADLPSGSDWPQGTFFWAEDTSTLYLNDGTTFNELAGGGGGGGSITTIESTDSTIDVTDGTGPTTDLAVADSPAVGGVTITGTPTAGQVPTATDGTDATWQDPAGDGGLPLGWTADAGNPANVATNGGSLAIDPTTGPFVGPGVIQELAGDASNVFTAGAGAAQADSFVQFFTGDGAPQQTATGALSSITDANAKAVLTSILAALVAYGLLADGTT